MTRSPEELAQIAFEVASEAAQFLYEGFRKRPAVREKGRADLVTEYDLASERTIRLRLAERTPEIAIVARLPCTGCAATEIETVAPRFERSASVSVKTRRAASQRSCGLNTFPTPVSGIASISTTFTGTAARSGVRSRTNSTSSFGLAFASGLSWM